MALKPHIVHIVGHTEAHHAATAEDIIEASAMAQQAIKNALGGQPDMSQDPAIQERVETLMKEARVTLNSIRDLSPSDEDPLIDPAVLAKVVQKGILDAPHLKNNPFARGVIQTRIVDGACVAIDFEGHPISESDRIDRLLKE